MLEKMEKSDNELRTELAKLNQVMLNIGSSVQQSVGTLGQFLSNQSKVFLHPQRFIMLEISYQTYILGDILRNVQLTCTSTSVEPQPSPQESDNVNEDQSQKSTIISIKFYSCKDM